MVECPICEENADYLFSSEDKNYQLTDRKFHLYRCHSCEAIFQYPLPDRSDVQKFYPDAYAPYQDQPRNDLIAKSHLPGKRTARKTPGGYEFSWRSLVPFLSRENRQKNVQPMSEYLPNRPLRHLDVGCGSGGFLAYMREHFDIQRSVGIDFDTRAVRSANERPGVTAYHDYMENFDPNDDFDFISANHILEHVTTPHQFVQNLYARLKNDGLLLINLPNTGGLGRRLFGASWVGFEVPRHVINYSVETTSILLKKHNFQIIHVETDSIFLESIKPILGYKRHAFRLPWGGRFKKYIRLLTHPWFEGDNQTILASKQS